MKSILEMSEDELDFAYFGGITREKLKILVLCERIDELEYLINSKTLGFEATALLLIRRDRLTEEITFLKGGDNE